MVRDTFGKISHKIDSGLRQTIGSHVGNTAQQCRHGLLQDSDFAGDFEDSKSTSGGVSCVFFWKQNICSSQLDVQDTNNQFLIAPQSLKLFLWILDYEWMGSLLLTEGNIVIEVLRTTKDNSQPLTLRESWADPTVPYQLRKT